MARTNAQTRAYINEIIEIKQEIDDLQVRKHELANKLGFGVHRSSDYPLVLVRVKRGGNGWRVNWKEIVEGLAKRFGLDIDKLTVGHRHRTYRKPCCSVEGDRAKQPRRKAA